VFVECHCFFRLHRVCLLETTFSLLNYIMFWKLPFSYISCMQYFDWINGAPLDWSLLASNTTRGGLGASLTGPPARLVYAHFSWYFALVVRLVSARCPETRPMCVVTSLARPQLDWSSSQTGLCALKVVGTKSGAGVTWPMMVFLHERFYIACFITQARRHKEYAWHWGRCLTVITRNSFIFTGNAVRLMTRKRVSWGPLGMACTPHCEMS